MKKATAHLPLLLDLTKREFKVRYLGSLFGSYWNILHPLMMILIYTVIFSQVMRARLGVGSSPYSYSLYLCSGLLAWNFFAEIVNRGAVTLLDNAQFLKKMAFPPYILFGATAASAAVNFFISLSLFLVALQLVQPVGLLHFLVYLTTVGLFAAFGTGLGMALGCLNVFMRDFQQVTSIVFQLWFWFTPIVYLYDSLPELAKRLLVANPSFPFLASFHDLLYFQRLPSGQYWLLMVGWTALSLAFGILIYRKSISLARDHL